MIASQSQNTEDLRLTDGEHQSSPSVRSHRRVELKPSRILLWLILAGILIIPTLAFLVQAIYPRLFGGSTQGSVVSIFAQALSGPTLRGILDSLWVSTLSATIATAIAGGLAWLNQRTNIAGRRLWPILLWVVLLIPSYLITEGWQRLLEAHGVLLLLGIDVAGFYHWFFGPAGVVIVLTVTGIPFSYLVLSAGLRGLGSEFGDAGRIHGARSRTTVALILPILAPAILSSIAIVFAESMSDFGVASTLAASANFPVATYSLFTEINSIPLNFPVAAAISWLLVGAAAIPILVQMKALKGRTYQIISSRSRPARIHQFTTAKRIIFTTLVAVFFVIAVGVPALGVVAASFLSNFGASYAVHALTLANYRMVLSGSLIGQPLSLSSELAALTATSACLLGVATAKAVTSKSGHFSARIIDLILLASVALPGIVLAAGYIFTYNLPIFSSLGINLYGTTKLLALGYLAGALPSTTRLLTAPVSQVQANIADSARVHGASATRAWLSAELPLLARPMLWAWLLTFAKTLLELPISQLLYAPGLPTISVAINKLTAGYDYGGGTAMSVLALGLAFLVIMGALGLFRLLAPAGWRQLGQLPIRKNG